MDQQQKEVNPVGPTIEVKYIDLPQVPVMHPDRFAELIGLSAGVVGGLDRSRLRTYSENR